jgi:PfaD family protein
VTPNRLVAKVSRVELAERFFAPPPANLLQELVAKGTITAEQAELAAQIPVAQDVTAEADSGGHTDNRPAIALLPTICAVRDRLQEQYRYAMPLRVGLGGGIGTPVSAAAAFAMGAAYVLTGTINQSCVESGTSDAVRTMLGAAEQADVAMAPAADMFEMGVTVQVLKRGTMFSMRAAKLYELYRKHNAIEEIPTEERTKLEKTMFRMPLDQVWGLTRAFFAERDPRQLERAEKNPKPKMAMVFRWYLGQASHWATRGEAGREVDYQVWCGPAMGAFNEWVKGTFLEPWTNRDVVTVALNILHGAAVVTRLSQLRQQGIALPPALQHVVPLERAQIEEYLR